MSRVRTGPGIPPIRAKLGEKMTTEQRKTYILFDPSSGRIVATHSFYDAQKRAYTHRPLEDVRSVFAGITDAQSPGSRSLEILETNLSPGDGLRGHFVDVHSRKVVPKP